MPANYITMGDECLKHDMPEAAMRNYEKAISLMSQVQGSLEENQETGEEHAEAQVAPKALFRKKKCE